MQARAPSEALATSLSIASAGRQEREQQARKQAIQSLRRIPGLRLLPLPQPEVRKGAKFNFNAGKSRGPSARTHAKEKRRNSLPAMETFQPGVWKRTAKSTEGTCSLAQAQVRTCSLHA